MEKINKNKFKRKRKGLKEDCGRKKFKVEDNISCQSTLFTALKTLLKSYSILC
jgi:hypothetical protein